ncbi:MAG: hypothetical protein V9G20_29145 [Candidatus Promineifilaceae bacterium]
MWGETRPRTNPNHVATSNIEVASTASGTKSPSPNSRANATAPPATATSKTAPAK